MKKIFFVVIVVATTIMFTSCATLFSAKKCSLELKSYPPGASIIMNGEKVGTTPTQLLLRADKGYTFRFEKEGFKPITRSVNTKVGTGWIILDVLGGVIPVIIDAVTTKWNVFDVKTIDVYLDDGKK